MSFKRSISRFAHVSGYTSTTYSEEGEIITSGENDGDVRVWQDISDDDPQSFCIGESARTCAQYSDNKKQLLIAATDNNSLQCFAFPTGDRDRVLFRFTASVTTVKVNKKVSKKNPIRLIVLLTAFI